DRLVYKALHPLEIDLGGALDDDVHPHRLRGEAADELQPRSEFVAVDVDHGERLDDADAASLGDRRHQLGIAARVHGAADERHLDAELAGDGSVEEGHWARL